MFADLASIHPRICPKRLAAITLRRQQIRDHTVKDHPSRTPKTQTQTIIRLQRIGLSRQRRTPTPLMEPVPPFRGIRKLADSYPESTGNSRTFDIFKAGPAQQQCRLPLTNRQTVTILDSVDVAGGYRFLITYFTFRSGG
jgi:hypothetical protein